MNIIIKFLNVVLRLLSVILAPLYWYKEKNQRQFLPPIKDELLKLSAIELADKIRNKTLTSEEICRSYINRIKDVNGILNAVVEDRFENALQDARKVDKFLQSNEFNKEEIKKSKPLLGVPLTVKESCSLAGQSFSVGTLTRVGIKADKDGDVVARMKASGAIPLLVSNTPELCLSWESFNYVTGRTNNAYNTTRTSSGSSGGEGALLGAAGSVIGIGSDVAGSIRLPAMFNGVFGHKPTPRLIPIKGHYPSSSDERLSDYLVIGPMARYAKDLTLMTRIMAGENAHRAKLDQQVDLKGLRLFFMEDAGSSWVQPKVQKEIRNAIKMAHKFLRKEYYAQLISETFPELIDATEIATCSLFQLRGVPNVLKGENQNLAVEIIKCLFGLSKYTFNLLFFYLLENVIIALFDRDYYYQENLKLRKKITGLLGDNGVFLFPTFTTTAFKHNEFYLKVDSISYLSIFNTLGLPATNVPCGLDRNGLPIGIQVVAGPYQDRLCLAVAEKLEKCFGGWVPPPVK